MTTLWRSTCRILPWVLAGAAVGCAAPEAPAPAPSPPAVAPAAPVTPPPAEQLESYPLVKGHPAVAAATAGLAAAPAADRPALLMRRAREAVAAAQDLRGGPRNSTRMPSWTPDHERFLAFYDLAVRDLDELLALSPEAPEAPEALFTMGLVHDYPHLELFDVALEAYQAAVRRYPDSPWAAKARERLGVLDGIMNPGAGDPHRGAEPAPGAPR